MPKKKNAKTLLFFKHAKSEKMPFFPPSQLKRISWVLPKQEFVIQALLQSHNPSWIYIRICVIWPMVVLPNGGSLFRLCENS